VRYHSTRFGPTGTEPVGAAVRGHRFGAGTHGSRSAIAGRL